jgi:hypothetical protein
MTTLHQKQRAFGGLAAMRNALRVSLTLLALSALAVASAPQATGATRAYGTITGSVKDTKGNAVAGAVVALLREGAKEVIKEVKSAADGSFIAKVSPGRYNLRATASGFNEVAFNAVQVRASDQLIYRFNLEPVGSGRTAPERRNDRNDPKWKIRANNGRRSIFQVEEGEDETINAVLEAQEAAMSRPDDTVFDTSRWDGKKPRIQGVVETYVAASSSPQASSYAGVNFALAVPINNSIDFIFAGQTGLGAAAPQRLDATARVRLMDHHRLSLSVSGARLSAAVSFNEDDKGTLGQVSVRAVDEWIVRDGIVVLLGVDYSRFVGASNSSSISPRLGFQFDPNARTRVRAAYASGGDENIIQGVAEFEGGAPIVFKQPVTEPVALVDGRAVMEKTRRFEFGVERVLDNESSVEATAFFDTTNNRGVGLMSAPLNAFSNENGAALLSVANHQGSAKGLRVVYTRRMGRLISASAGYSFGRGQRLSPEGLTNPSDLFQNGFFQTAAFQLNAQLSTGTNVRTVFRFSPGATVFAIDPFAGRLAVYDPSLSILITQELPTFGLPVRAEAVIDARNLLDVQQSAEDGETLLLINAMRRSVRGGISVRF